MADVVYTTGAPACASQTPPSSPQSPDVFDPLDVLLSAYERQLAAWDALPPEADLWRDRIAFMTLDETGALLGRFHPTTPAGALRALRHALDGWAAECVDVRGGYRLPMARNALAALERLAVP